MHEHDKLTHCTYMAILTLIPSTYQIWKRHFRRVFFFQTPFVRTVFDIFCFNFYAIWFTKIIYAISAMVGYELTLKMYEIHVPFSCRQSVFFDESIKMLRLFYPLKRKIRWKVAIEHSDWYNIYVYKYCEYN